MEFDDVLDYVKIAKVSDFDAVRVKSFRLLARPVGVFKRPDGTFFAMEVGCKHENADLTQGRMQGDVVTCPWHGWKYNLRTGECIHGGDLPLRRHGLKVEQGNIYITLRPLPD